MTTLLLVGLLNLLHWWFKASWWSTRGVQTSAKQRASPHIVSISACFREIKEIDCFPLILGRSSVKVPQILWVSYLPLDLISARPWKFLHLEGNLEHHQNIIINISRKFYQNLFKTLSYSAHKQRDEYWPIHKILQGGKNDHLHTLYTYREEGGVRFSPQRCTLKGWFACWFALVKGLPDKLSCGPVLPSVWLARWIKIVLQMKEFVREWSAFPEMEIANAKRN